MYFPRRPQAKNEELEVLNQKYQKQINDLQHRLNTVIEENIQLRSAQQRSTPPSVTTPTSPLPPISELTADKEEVEEEEEEMEEDTPKDVYAVVDYSKVRAFN